MTARIQQLPENVDLEWWQGDAVNLSWLVDANWSGVYTASIVPSDGGTPTPLTVTATWSSPAGQTSFVATLSAISSAQIPAGTYRWSAETADLTRFAGNVIVRERFR